MELLVATTNAGKLREIRGVLGGLSMELVTLARWPPIAPPDETGQTFEENARQKALYYAASTGHLTVAEDSGLEIDALAGAPGVESARFGGADASYPEKFGLIYEALRSRGASTSPARFVCALALADSGRIVFEAREWSKAKSLPPRAERGIRLRPDSSSTGRSAAPWQRRASGRPK